MRHDFYHLPGYVSLAGKHESGSPIAFYAEDDGAVFFAPLLLKRIPESLGPPGSWLDATTPYGYPSPLLWPPDDGQALERFLQVFSETCAEHGIITAFFRLHPLMTLPQSALMKQGTLIRHGQTVCVDLARTHEDFWSQMDRTHRKDIRRLMRLGYEIRIDDWHHYDDFIDIYRRTMERLSATAFYAFPKSYFHELRFVLGDNIHLCAIISPEQEVAAAGLFTTVNGITQYHLSGTADKYLKESPSKMLCEAIYAFSKQVGNEFFHLGGGLGGRNDSLFRFKAGFSNLRLDFFTYRMILDKRKNALLMELWRQKCAVAEDKFNTDFFPSYRRLQQTGVEAA
jgi:lipid II:glycine glycyltransferase (peptidoglycan interpeptide bridge formation enzyme)